MVPCRKAAPLGGGGEGGEVGGGGGEEEVEFVAVEFVVVMATFWPAGQCVGSPQMK